MGLVCTVESTGNLLEVIKVWGKSIKWLENSNWQNSIRFIFQLIGKVRNFLTGNGIVHHSRYTKLIYIEKLSLNLIFVFEIWPWSSLLTKKYFFFCKLHVIANVLFALSKVLQARRVNYLLFFLHMWPSKNANIHEVSADFVNNWHILWVWLIYTLCKVWTL